MIITVFWDVISYSLVNCYHCFGATWCICLQGSDLLWRWMHQVPLKNLYWCTRLHHVRSLKTVVFTYVRTPHKTWLPQAHTNFSFLTLPFPLPKSVQMHEIVLFIDTTVLLLHPQFKLCTIWCIIHAICKLVRPKSHP